MLLLKLIMYTGLMCKRAFLFLFNYLVIVINNIIKILVKCKTIITLLYYDCIIFFK
jgi:hypothetical protein